MIGRRKRREEGTKRRIRSEGGSSLLVGELQEVCEKDESSCVSPGNCREHR